MTIRPDVFDELARQAARTSRLGFLRRAAGLGITLLGGNAAASALAPSASGADGAVPSSVTCQYTQASVQQVSLMCQDLNAYIAQCGVICPSGSPLPGRAGCTDCAVRPSNPTATQPSYKHVDGLWCATTTVSITWTGSCDSSYLEFHMLNPCCRTPCEQHVSTVTSQLAQHELGHKTEFEQLKNELNQRWTSRSFTACDPGTVDPGKKKQKPKSTKDGAFELLANIIRDTINIEQAEIDQKLRHDEPPQADLVDCNICRASTATTACCGGTCVDTSSDPRNCGRCGNVCASGVCSNGTCTSTCTCKASTDTNPASGCCPPGYTCAIIYDGQYPSCCNSTLTECVCPSGYHPVVPNDGLCHKD